MDKLQACDSQYRAGPAPTAPVPPVDRGRGHTDVVAPTREPWSPLRRAAVLGVLAALGAGALLTVGRYWTAYPDDAFITMRVARSIADGHGWTYNVAQHSNPATSSLQTMLLAAGYAIAGHMFAVANVLFALTAGLAAGAASLLVPARRGWLVASGVVLFFASPLVQATKGLEATLFAALCLVALAAHVHDRERMLGVALALLVICRPDGALFALVIVAWRVVESRRLPIVTIVTAAAVALPMQVAIALATHAAFPNSFAAKVAQGRSGLWGSDRFFPSFALRLRQLDSMHWFELAAVLAVIGVVVHFRDTDVRRWAAPLLAGTAAHYVVYGSLKVPGYHWYYAPELLAVAMLAGVGVWTLTRTPVVTLASLAVAIALLSPRTPGPTKPEYVALGKWLAAHTQPRDRVAATEIGIIGWYSHRPIIDYLGLLDTRAAHDLEHHRLTAWLSRTRPDYWVVHEPSWIFETPGLHTQLFRDHYRLVDVPTEITRAGDQEVFVYHRVD